MARCLFAPPLQRTWLRYAISVSGCAGPGLKADTTAGKHPGLILGSHLAHKQSVNTFLRCSFLFFIPLAPLATAPCNFVALVSGLPD